MPIWLQPWEVMHAGGQFEGRQPGSLRAGGSSDAVGDRGPAGGRLQAENPHPPTSRTSGDRRQHTSQSQPTSSFGPNSNNSLSKDETVRSCASLGACCWGIV